MRIQAFLTAAAVNLKRLAAALHARLSTVLAVAGKLCIDLARLQLKMGRVRAQGMIRPSPTA
jgi:hypothetical protein